MQKIYDLFGGIGGFSEAARRVGWSTAGYCEIDKNAVAVYNKNFGTNHTPTDVRKINTEELPDFDILTAGFPCQSFSIAGLRKGFDDERGNLFFEIARILRDKKPKMFLLENVAGLLSSDNRSTFRTIIDTLRELGYVGQYQVFNSKYFGVPQNRERVFILGFRGKSGPQIFPLGADVQEVDELQGQAANTLTARYEGAQATGTYIIENQQHAQGEEPVIIVDAYNASVVDIPGAVRQNMGSAGPLVMSLQPRSPDRPCLPVLTPNRENKRQHGRRFKSDGEPAFTLTAQDRHGISDGARIRRLTPLECERLQNYRDGWTEGVSDSQRYRLLGNSITVSVAEAIFREVQKCI